jgi:spermidine synthase
MQPVGFGVAAVLTDPARPAGRILLVDGVEQSYVDLDDPTYLHFEYVRRMASVVDAVAPRGAAVRALHLGGGALTLPRYLAATRPGSTQVVVERDRDLVALVRRELPLPDGELRMVVGDARDAVEAEAEGRFHLVLADVYQGAQMPARVANVEFAKQAARALRPDGFYAVNVTDLPPLVLSRAQAATLRVAFADVCLIAGQGMLRGRRYGNVVLAAARRPDRLPVGRLATQALRDRVRGQVVHGADLDRFLSGTRPVTDEG